MIRAVRLEGDTIVAEGAARVRDRTGAAADVEFRLSFRAERIREAAGLALRNRSRSYRDAAMSVELVEVHAPAPWPGGYKPEGGATKS